MRKLSCCFLLSQYSNVSDGLDMKHYLSTFGSLNEMDNWGGLIIDPIRTPTPPSPPPPSPPPPHGLSQTRDSSLQRGQTINISYLLIDGLDARRFSFSGVETVLEDGPLIGWHTFSSDLICQRMPPVPTFPPMAIAMVALTPLSMSVQI